MDNPLFWAFVLLVIGLAVIVVELFIPSGGLLGLVSISVLVLSVIFAFAHSQAAGFSFLALLAVAIPTIVIGGLKILPKTPIGKRIFLAAPTADQFDTDQSTVPKDLVGTFGVTLTPLRPAGITELDGRRVDTISEGIVIDVGERVRVVEVSGQRVVVRQVHDSDSVSENSDLGVDEDFA